MVLYRNSRQLGSPIFPHWHCIQYQMWKYCLDSLKCWDNWASWWILITFQETSVTRSENGHSSWWKKSQRDYFDWSLYHFVPCIQVRSSLLCELTDIYFRKWWKLVQTNSWFHIHSTSSASSHYSTFFQLNIPQNLKQLHVWLPKKVPRRPYSVRDYHSYWDSESYIPPQLPVLELPELPGHSIFNRIEK